jgi:hypothetical protein
MTAIKNQDFNTLTPAADFENRGVYLKCPLAPQCGAGFKGLSNPKINKLKQNL